MIKELGGCLLWVRNCLALNNSFETLTKDPETFLFKNCKTKLLCEVGFT